MESSGPSWSAFLTSCKRSPVVPSILAFRPLIGDVDYVEYMTIAPSSETPIEAFEVPNLFV